jgi:hypothetical protein
MKMHSRIFLVITLSLFGGCSYLINRIDSRAIEEKEYQKNLPQKSTFCPVEEKVKIALVNTNAPSQEAYLKFTQKIPGMDFLDHVVLWSLAQMAIRPDLSAPTSRLQILLRKDGKNHYLDFFSDETENQFPSLYGLEWILKRYKKNKSLESYASILDASELNFRVEKGLEQFLGANLEAIKNDPILAPFYIRGTEGLKENERVPGFKFHQLIKLYRKQAGNQKITLNTSLLSYASSTTQNIRCNYDFNLYEKSIFLIDKTLTTSNLFGLSHHSEAFLASTSHSTTPARSLDKLPLFAGHSKVRSSAVCLFEVDQSSIWTFSTNSRDPGQHLFHLSSYGLPLSQSAQDVDRLIRHSRHLFLSSPLRLVIESQRSHEDQIENLLKLNLPIYHAEKLGNIWAYSVFKNQGRFILDDRNPGAYLCK